MKFIDLILDESINPFLALNRNRELTKQCEELMSRFDNIFVNHPYNVR